jgi:transcriptional regulator with XRE-family HTH domain
MKKYTQARVHSSPLLDEILAESTPLEGMQTKNKLIVASRIAHVLEERGWNKSEFAERLQKHPSEVTKWLSGTHNFTLDVLSVVCDALGVELSDLFSAGSKQVVYRQSLLLESNASVVYELEPKWSHAEQLPSQVQRKKTKKQTPSPTPPRS